MDDIKRKIDSGYRGDEYKELVTQLKRIANWTCNKCGYHAEKGSLDRHNILVHHIDRNPYNHKLSNLEVLCDTCHYLITWGQLDQASDKVDAHYPKFPKRKKSSPHTPFIKKESSLLRGNV